MTTSKPVYQIWLLGYGEFGDCTEFTYQVSEHENLNDAKDVFNIIKNKGLNILKTNDPDFYIPADTYSVSVVIEEVIVDENENEECVDFVEENYIQVRL